MVCCELLAVLGEFRLQYHIEAAPSIARPTEPGNVIEMTEQSMAVSCSLKKMAVRSTVQQLLVEITNMLCRVSTDLSYRRSRRNHRLESGVLAASSSSVSIGSKDGSASVGGLTPDRSFESRGFCFQYTSVLASVGTARQIMYCYFPYRTKSHRVDKQ